LGFLLSALRSSPNEVVANDESTRPFSVLIYQDPSDLPRNLKDMSEERKVALITGITGQDGSYLTELLLEKGYIVSIRTPFGLFACNERSLTFNLSFRFTGSFVAPVASTPAGLITCTATVTIPG
jgi:GDP-mannose 4,6 dehydratase